VEHELQFYCEDCELEFQSAPDGTGFEQAACPACGYVCMTVEFHEQESERNRAGRAGFLGAISPVLFTGYGFLVPLFGLLCVIATEIVAEGVTKDDEYYQTHAWPLAFAMFCAGILSLFVGRQLAERFEQPDAEQPNAEPESNETDREEKAIHEPMVRDTFFSVEMPYWGPILFVVALVSLLSRGL
jgi:hypothetical protein